jgi:hypothetical protein
VSGVRASGRLQGLALVGAALAVYALEAWAWPLAVGRDLDEYLYGYIQLFDGHPLLPWSMAFRTPVAGLVTGATLDLGSGWPAEALAAVLYAVSILLWAKAARSFGTVSGWVLPIVLLLYPGYAGMFHEFGAEMCLGVAFAAWTLLVCRAAERPSVGRFVAVGLGIALLALIRPGNAVVVILALFPLVLAASWRRRLTWAAATAAAALVPMGLWVVHNGVTFGDYTFARGANAIIPFYRVFLDDRLVSPDNGSSSRRMAAAIASDLVAREPYRSYGVGVDDVFARPSFRVHEDLMSLSDEVWGWSSAYSTLRSVAIEAIREHPGAYASGVYHTLVEELKMPYYRVPGSPSSHAATKAATVVVKGRTLPAPSEGQLIPGGQNIWISTPDNRIHQVWTSPTAYDFTFTHPGDRRRFDEITTKLDRLLVAFPHRSGNTTVAHQLNRISHRFPQPLYVLALGVIVLVIRRPRRLIALIVPPLAALAVIGLTALGSPADPHYVFPLAPAFYFFFVGSLFGERGRAAARSVG